MNEFVERRTTMDKLSFLPISIEKFAAYLDGNLAESEMCKVDSLVMSNSNLKEITEISDIIDEDAQYYHQDELAYNYEIGIIDENLVLPNLDESLVGDLNYHQEGINNMDLNGLEDMEKSNWKNTSDLSGEMIARSIYGEEGMGISDAMIYQGNEGICAIRSQQIILRDYGIDVSIDELKQLAIQNGWYDSSPEGGTPLWAIGNLLQSCNVDCRQQFDCTIYDLVNELSQGHRVIVGVDANELWASRNNETIEGAKEWFKDFFKGETANHALIVAGVEVNPENPKDVTVVLTDPGTGDLRIEYELDEFMDAWEDSHCFMTTTTTPAPLQYDPHTGSEIPSNFAVAEFINTNSLPLNPNNVILSEEMAAMCAFPYYEEGHLDTITIDGHDVDFDRYTQTVVEMQKYKSIMGGVNLPGQNHFDFEVFKSSLMRMLGFEDSINNPIIDSVNEPVNNPINNPINDPVDDPVDDPTDEEDDDDDDVEINY